MIGKLQEYDIDNFNTKENTSQIISTYTNFPKAPIKSIFM